jgi:CubicO group peptidase (beta-lactamase class C family)
LFVETPFTSVTQEPTMLHRRCRIMHVFFAITCGLLCALEASGGEERFAALEAAVNASVGKGECPGAVVLVWRQGRVAYRKSFGDRVRVPEPTLMSDDTVFDLASLSKPIGTALAIMLLVEDGKIDVQDSLAKHLPAFARKETEGITLAQLLTHTAGFIADNPLGDYLAGRDKAWEKLFALKPTQAPGSKFVYSDVGYILLGKVVEKASGMPLDEFTRTRLFEPLGMKDTGYRLPDPLKKRCAPTQQREGRWMIGEVHDPRAYHLGGVAGHAGLFSTADDLAIIARMLLEDGKHQGKAFLRPDTVRLMTASRQVPGPKEPGLRTFGWDMATAYSSNRGDAFTKGVSFGHTGFTGTSIWLDPPTQTAVIFLSNRVHPGGKGNVTPLRGRVATLAAKALSME